MRPTFEELAAFVQVVDAGSISAAARRMGMSKSVLSARVASLEACLAVTLLRRTTRSMVLTDAGAGFYEQARDILARLEEASLEATCAGGAGGRLHGSLRIAAPVSFGTTHLSAMLMPFLQQNPRLECRIELDDRAVDLLEGRFDLAIRIGRLPDSSLVARRLGEGRRVVCASPDYLARKGRPETLEDLRHHDIIGYAHASASRLWTFTDASGRSIVAPAARPRIVANNGELIRDAALAGLGLTVMPRFIVGGALAAGGLLQVLSQFEPLPEPIQAVYPQERRLPLKTRLLIDYLAPAVGARQW